MTHEWVHYWWVVLPLLPVALYFVPLRIGTWYEYSERGQSAGIALILIRGRLRFQRVFNLKQPLTPDPVVMAEPDTPGPRRPRLLNRKTGRFVSQLRLMMRPYDLLPKPLHIGRLEIVGRVGTGDVALTGFIVGSLYAAVHLVLAPLNTFAIYGEAPRIEFTPDYHDACFEASLNCILLLRVGDIMKGLLKVLLAQTVKGVRRTWKSIPSRV